MTKVHNRIFFDFYIGLSYLCIDLPPFSKNGGQESTLFTRDGSQGGVVYHIVYRGLCPIIGSEELYCRHFVWLVKRND